MNLLIKKKHQLKQDLRIPYLVSPKDWPGLALSGQSLNQFDSSEDFEFTEVDPLLELDPKARTQLYFQAHAHLSFLQKLSLLQSPAFGHFFDQELVWASFPPRSPDELFKMSSLISALPEKFKSWLHEKELQFYDLAPVLSFKVDQDEFQSFSMILEKWDQINFSRSLGAQTIELLVELCLLGHTFDSLMKLWTAPGDELLKNLKILRFPQVTLNDENKKNHSLQWPSSTQVQTQRRGDRWGYNIHFFVSGHQELNKTIEQFKKAAEQWKNQSL
jgi:hypothetical protein